MTTEDILPSNADEAIAQVEAVMKKLTPAQRYKLMSMAAFLMPAIEDATVTTLLVMAAPTGENNKSMLYVSTYNADDVQALRVARGALHLITEKVLGDGVPETLQ